MNLRRGFPVLLDLALTQVGASSPTWPGSEQGCCNRARPGAWLDIWIILNLLQLFLLYFYNLYNAVAMSFVDKPDCILYPRPLYSA